MHCISERVGFWRQPIPQSCFSNIFRTAFRSFIRTQFPTIQKKVPRFLAGKSITASVMPSSADPRKTPGTSVHAKAKDVTCLAEARRRYGRVAESKFVPGIVVQASFKAGQKRGSWYIATDYEPPGAPKKRVELNSRSVHLGDPPTTSPFSSLNARVGALQPGIATDDSIEQEGGRQQPALHGYSGPSFPDLRPCPLHVQVSHPTVELIVV